MDQKLYKQRTNLEKYFLEKPLNNFRFDIKLLGFHESLLYNSNQDAFLEQSVIRFVRFSVCTKGLINNHEDLVTRK